MANALFGRLGWWLLVVTVTLVIITAITLPYLMPTLGLEFPTKWADVTRFVVQVTFGSWVGTVAVSIARIIIWLRATFSLTTLEQYSKERKDVTYVRDFSLWLLGIMTALAGYMTVWIGG